MIAVAVVFLVLAALLVLWFLLATGDSADVDLSAAGLDVHVSPLVVFVLGAVALGLLLAALRFFYWGSKRGARKRRERKDLEKQAKVSAQQRDEALAEREREHARLVEREQAAAGPLADRDADSRRLDTDRPLSADGRRTDDLDVDGRPLGDRGLDDRGRFGDDLPPDDRR
ncbi:hypothetical protein [Luteipulveratus halotolerans]|uniref:Lipopolysaccharide assembly protein A domain-containing protein n=1 Tax=Luteipulveratus halotolerans TaxID=1631356 RepID=A0A0L6CEX7_9MICO|nr:hypothetical protein [Luteipulveratus halotolerans]KNX36125.1 hypothetical protein VV01_01515 [Luteipulveratus halotolerans]